MTIRLRTPTRIDVLRPGASFQLERGGEINHAQIGFELNGDGPVVVVLGGISAGRHVASNALDPRPGWWEPLTLRDRALDTRRVRLLSIDWLGGRGSSSGPLAAAESTTHPPVVTTFDQARAILAVLDHLGLERADAVVGASYGGMVALALVTLDPGRVERAVVIAAADRSHPMATALRSLQRRVVQLGVRTGRSSEGLAIARGIAMTTYRTATEFASRFGTSTLPGAGPARFEVDAYLEHCGRRFADTFTPDAFLCLSESLDLHAIEATDVKAPTTLIAFDSDTLVPSHQMRLLYERVPAPAGFVEISSLYGHDAFLKEIDAMSAALNTALEPSVR